SARTGGGTYGLGVVIRGSGRTLPFAHDGVNAGFESRLVVYLEAGQGSAILVNRNGTAVVLKELFWDRDSPSVVPPIAVTSTIDRYNGASAPNPDSCTAANHVILLGAIGFNIPFSLWT